MVTRFRPARGLIIASVRLHLLPGIFLAVALASCSGDSAAPGATQDIDTFTAGLPSWQAFSPPQADSEYILESGVSETDELVEGTMYKCNSTPYSLTKTPDKVVTLDPDVNILWLGALLQGSGYKDGIGSLAEWSVRERAPLDISLDLLSSQNSKRVERPTLASVNQALGALVQTAQAAGHRGGSSVSYSSQTTHSIFQATLALGLSKKFIGSDVSLKLSGAHSADKTTITAYFVQRMFTTSFVLPNHPSDLFGPDFTPARLQQEIDAGLVGSSNPPVYVASIVYGRILMFTFTSKARVDSIRLALNAAYNTILERRDGTPDTAASSGGDLDAKIKQILETADIRVVTVGGEGRNALALIRTGKLADYFNEDAALTSARPISYTVRNLGDNSIARVSETTEYDLKECEAVPTTGQIKIDVTPNDASVSVLGPGGYTFPPKTGDQLLTELTPGGYSVTVARQGFDTARIETTVNAGAVTELPVTLRDPTQTITGAIYAITMNRIILQNVSCAETYPDVYHDIQVAGKTLTQRLRENYVELQVGEWDHKTLPPLPDVWGTVVDTVFFSKMRLNNVTTTDTVMAFTGGVWDSDGVSANDQMANVNLKYYKTNIPTGANLGANVGTGGCAVRLDLSITKTGDMFN